MSDPYSMRIRWHEQVENSSMWTVVWVGTRAEVTTKGRQTITIETGEELSAEYNILSL